MDRASFLDAFHQRMETFRRTGKMCDAKLIAKGSDRQGRKNKTTPVEFLVHMSVLSAASAHFEQVFDAGMKESVVGVVELNMDADILEKLIVYMYTGHIQIDADSAPHILPEAAYLQLADLREACAKFLLSNITLSNCLEMWSFACIFSCEEMKELAWKTACENFDTVSTSPHIVQMNRESLVLLIKDKRLRCKESSIYTAVIAWVRGGEERKQHLAELLSHVRLTSMEPAFLAGTVGKEPLIRKDAECFDLFLEALESLSSFSGVTQSARDRTPFKMAWPIVDGAWSHGPSIDMYIGSFQVVIVNLQIYCVLTGGDGRSAKFDVATGEWQNMHERMNCMRGHKGLCTDGNFIYGHNNNHVTPYCTMSEMSGCGTSAKYYLDFSRIAVEIHSIVVVDETLFIADETSLYKCEAKDPYDYRGTCTCTKIADFPSPRCFYRLFAANGEIYVIGGRHGPSEPPALSNSNSMSPTNDIITRYVYRSSQKYVKGSAIYNISQQTWRDEPHIRLSMDEIERDGIVQCDRRFVRLKENKIQCLYKTKWIDLPDPLQVKVMYPFRSISYHIAAQDNVLFAVSTARKELGQESRIQVHTLHLDDNWLRDLAQRQQSESASSLWLRQQPMIISSS